MSVKTSLDESSFAVEAGATVEAVRFDPFGVEASPAARDLLPICPRSAIAFGPRTCCEPSLSASTLTGGYQRKPVRDTSLVDGVDAPFNAEN